MTTFKNSERTQGSDLIKQLKNLEKQEQNKCKPTRQQEIINIRAEMNEIETKKITQRIHESAGYCNTCL